MDASTTIPFEFDRWEQSTLVSALIFYAIQIYDPTECLNCLTKLVPEPKKPWTEIIEEGRASWRTLGKTADDEVAAMREP